MRYGPSSFITMKKITCSRLKLDSDFYFHFPTFRGLFRLN